MKPDIQTSEQSSMFPKVAGGGYYDYPNTAEPAPRYTMAEMESPARRDVLRSELPSDGAGPVEMGGVPEPGELMGSTPSKFREGR